jgi:superfamily II DNA or RNA helicase
MYLQIAEHLYSNKRKAIVVVPQIMIEKEFGTKQLETKHGILTLIPSKSDDANSDESKRIFVDKFIKTKVFEDDSNIIDDDRFLVCPYPTFINWIESITDESLLDNLFVCIDEAHHLQSEENALGVVEKNKLSAACEKIYNAKNTRLLLVTATYFRGDGRNIIPDEMMSKAVRYNMTLANMLSDSDICQDLKSISFQYSLTSVSLKKIMKTFHEENKFTGYWIPSVNANESNGKKADVTSICESLGKRITDKNTLLKLGVTAEEFTEANGIIEYYKTNTGFLHKVLDLALDDNSKLYASWKNRAEREDFLIKYQNDPIKYKWITDVIALNKMKEGTNWKPMNRVVIIGYRGSWVDFMQIIGRSFRHWPGKENVDVLNVMPMKLAHLNEEDAADEIRKHLTCVYSIMSLEDMIAPASYSLGQKETREDNRERVEQRNLILELFEGKEDKLNTFYERVHTDSCRELKGIELEEAKELFGGIIERNLKMSGISVDSDELKEVSERMWRRLARITKANYGDMVSLSFDVVDSYTWYNDYMLFVGKAATTSVLDMVAKESFLARGMEKWDTQKFIRWCKENHPHNIEYRQNKASAK